MDTEFASLREKERLKRLEKQIEAYLLSLDYKQLVKEIDYECTSGPDKMELVQILCNIRLRQPDNKKLKKLISHYVFERDGMVVLKP